MLPNLLTMSIGIAAALRTDHSRTSLLYQDTLHCAQVKSTHLEYYIIFQMSNMNSIYIEPQALS